MTSKKSALASNISVDARYGVGYSVFIETGKQAQPMETVMNINFTQVIENATLAAGQDFDLLPAHERDAFLALGTIQYLADGEDLGAEIARQILGGDTSFGRKCRNRAAMRNGTHGFRAMTPNQQLAFAALEGLTHYIADGTDWSSEYGNEVLLAFGIGGWEADTRQTA